MEQVVKHMTHWLLKKHLIVPEQSEWCHYMLMQSTMSILSLCLLLPVSAAIVGVWGSVFYTATFRILRQRTGGYHARTPHGCLLVSFVLQVLFSLLGAATKDLYVLTTVILLSEVAIFLLGPANHPELHLSAKELKAVKPRMYVRQAIAFLAYVVALLTQQGMVASCIAVATFAVAVLLAVAHVDDGEIHRFKKEHVNQKEVIQTMNEKESMMHKATRKALDVMIRRTYDGWPPNSCWGVYQPHRPEKPLPKPQEKK